MPFKLTQHREILLNFNYGRAVWRFIESRGAMMQALEEIEPGVGDTKKFLAMLHVPLRKNIA